MYLQQGLKPLKSEVTAKGKGFNPIHALMLCTLTVVELEWDWGLGA